MSKNSKIIYLFLTSVFFVLFNFYFSDYILNNGYLLTENPIFNITYIQNRGAAFSIFDGYKIFLIGFSAAALGVLIFFAIKQITKISVFGLFFTSLLLSGIFNNMCERLIFGYVRDYINLKFITFPVFNMADIFITIGVIALVAILLFYKGR